ncbi:HTH domain-containing protein [Oribacterium sp. oral taxon 078]|uniref:HTH domain-containing protein n=1 Tax=Oribacterium sp. oral taxon 078 TaxID=652706 RepID=UPI00058D285E|nr:HTH domain-containing protein [Oribacterium sp. oral taxon 078]
MSKVKFTPEQQQMLRENPYTIHMTADVLSISKEFKEIFYKEYLSGALPRDILQKHAYPADVLGKQRIWGISHRIRKQFEETGEFSDIRTPTISKTGATPEEKIRQLEYQVNYLTQEVEFLKKFPRSEVPGSRCRHYA